MPGGADRSYDSSVFVSECRDLNITPHAAQKKRQSAMGGRTTCHQIYRASQKGRKRGMTATRFIGRAFWRAWLTARLLLRPLSIGTRLKLLTLFAVGLTVLPYLFWVIHARRCRRADHDHSVVRDLLDEEM